MVTIHESEPYIQPLNEIWYKPYVDEVSMLRLDVIHPVISGNKWYKLKWNIKHAIENGFTGVLTFGGGYSNHLIATAATAYAYGLKSIGIVRGSYTNSHVTSTLKTCAEYGMQLVFVTKGTYRSMQDKESLHDLQKEYSDYFIIPEGGANEWGREGAMEIARYIPESYTHICISVGTGTSFTGLRNTLLNHQYLYGYIPMKERNYLELSIRENILSANNRHWQLFNNWHFGGFGKRNDELIQFMNHFYEVNKIPLDIVYTGKMMAGIYEQLHEGYFSATARILCIHTGGLQGNVSAQHLLEY